MVFLRRSFKIGIIFLFLRISTSIASAALSLKDAPCAFEQTVPLDPSQELKNGSYLYNNITVVPMEQTGTYNYEITIGNEKHSTDIHVRGCICDKPRPCISICCPDEGEYSEGICNETQYVPNEYFKISSDAEGDQQLELEFITQIYRPCANLYYLQPSKNQQDHYKIMKNGSLFKPAENRLYTKDSYCLSPTLNRNSEFKYVPLQCIVANPTNTDQIKMNAVALLISVPFMVLTIIVYLYLPHLRTIHGLSFCCYLAGLSVGYLTLAYLILTSPDKAPFQCSFLGYTTYFGFMSAFFWLSVISFDLTYNFHGYRTNQKMKQFRLYCLYAYGLALICTICTYTAQHTDHLPDSWKSGMGKDFCFLDTIHGWSALIYFYCPMLLIVGFNTVMFVKSFIRIKETIQSSNSNGAHKPHYEQKVLFMTFLRLFIIMGITWIAELMAYVSPQNSWLHKVFRITDLLNAIQGVTIFLLFVVLRKSVRRELLKKCGKEYETPQDRSQEMTECL